MLCRVHRLPHLGQGSLLRSRWIVESPDEDLQGSLDLRLPLPPEPEERCHELATVEPRKKRREKRANLEFLLLLIGYENIEEFLQLIYGNDYCASGSAAPVSPSAGASSPPVPCASPLPDSPPSEAGFGSGLGSGFGGGSAFLGVAGFATGILE